jgi:hypothetical protein
MALDCLIGYIGLASSIGTAESGLYLDALPDINLNNTKKIADSGQRENDVPSVEDVFNDVQQRSILKFRTFFTSELNRCFKVFKRDSIDCLICENKELLVVALWYLMGAEMLQERLGSERINRFTTVDRTRSKELQQTFMEEFFSELANAVPGIDIDGSDCFEDDEHPECTPFIKVIETCP